MLPAFSVTFGSKAVNGGRGSAHPTADMGILGWVKGRAVGCPLGSDYFGVPSGAESAG